MVDVLVIGSGPAGISAAIYASRAGLKALVLGKHEGALMKAHRIENYYGFAEPISGERLLADGIAQARGVGADVREGQVVSIEYDGRFTVKTAGEAYGAKCVVLATGSNRTAPKIEGFTKFEGAGISYCAACDAFFYRGRDVAVLGCCEYALHEAMELLPVAGNVTLLTNGVDPIAEIPKEIPVIREKIASFEGGETLRGVRFADGSGLAVEGVFVAIGVAGSTDLARKLGAQTEGLRIVVDETMATSVPGLFAAGDCTGGMMQIAKAVYDGARAGTEAVKFIRRGGAGT